MIDLRKSCQRVTYNNVEFTISKMPNSYWVAARGESGWASVPKTSHAKDMIIAEMRNLLKDYQ